MRNRKLYIRIALNQYIPYLCPESSWNYVMSVNLIFFETFTCVESIPMEEEINSNVSNIFPIWIALNDGTKTDFISSVLFEGIASMILKTKTSVLFVLFYLVWMFFLFVNLKVLWMFYSSKQILEELLKGISTFYVEVQSVNL